MKELLDFKKLMETEEPLCDDLLPYYSDDGVFPMIQHPLVYSVPHSPQQNALANERLRKVREFLIQNIEEKNISGYIYMHEKPYRLDAFVKAISIFTVPDKEYWERLGDVWTNSENIYQNYRAWKNLLLSKRSHREYLMDSSEREVFDNLDNEITIYRGYHKSKRGMSWTLEEERAKWFANRFTDQGKVLTATAQKKDLIAYLNGRSEEEIIVLPENVSLH